MNVTFSGAQNIKRNGVDSPSTSDGAVSVVRAHGNGGFIGPGSGADLDSKVGVRLHGHSSKANVGLSVQVQHSASASVVELEVFQVIEDNKR